MSPKTPLPRPKCRWHDTENEAGYATPKQVAKLYPIPSAVLFWTGCADPTQARHARKTARCTAGRRHNAPFPPLPATSDRMRNGAFHAGNASHPSSANAGKSAMGWKPAGPKPRSGFGSRQPGARGLSSRGRHILGHLLHPVMISAISASLMCSAGLIRHKIHK